VYTRAPGNRATTDFTLTSVNGNTATGTVTAASDLRNDTIGGPVTATLVPGAGGHGQMLQMSMGKTKGWNFCNASSQRMCGA
jgi:serine/threonine-protein kinase